MPTTFDALASNHSSSSSSDSDKSDDETKKEHIAAACMEDLTIQREDEEVVLIAVYGEDYAKEDGVWGYPIHCVHVRPPDIEKERIGSELTMKAQLVRKYPYVAPTIQLDNVKGLTPNEQKELLKILKTKSRQLAKSGLVMVCELVQSVEDFLLTHNKDPTNANVSAWDQMQQREEEKKKMDQEAKDKLDFMGEISPSRLKEYDSQHTNHEINEFEKERIEREYERQKKALIAAKDRRMGQGDNDNSVDNSYDDDESDFDESYHENDALTSSRYQNDFIQLEKLGKGGGGEVVKVRNRLDKRIYAVKKVILQSEHGRMEKFGKLENAKLKREVTTISRMTHKNIVRYYQAWVEGGEKIDSNSTIDENSKMDPSKLIVEEDGDELSSHSREASESSESSREGFWMSSFHEVDSIDSSSSWSEEDESTSTPQDDANNDEFTFMHSPLLVGFGVEKKPKIEQRNSSSSESKVSQESESELDTSLIKKKLASGRSTLYIQMEYCSNTLRNLIDDQSLQDMDQDGVWKVVIQILEALEYIHKRKVIHRDLKPGNIFLDSENNVRLGDFGLATTGKSDTVKERHIEDTSIEAIDDISHLLGGSSHVSNKSLTNDSTITGGVGTRFYCAPEQEGRSTSETKGRTSYDFKADIFSLGIVIFEMFHPPFVTLMERAETLEKLRACSNKYPNLLESLPKQNVFESDLWKDHAAARFPENFLESPKNVQKLILWCLQLSPEHRPSAEQILKSDLIPQLDSSNEFLKEIFTRQTTSVSNEIDITWDTDAAAKIREFFPLRGKKSVMNSLLHNLKEVVGTSWKESIGLQLSAMNCVAMVAANIALKRAMNAGTTRGASQQIASILAMSAATAGASNGSGDGSIPQLTSSVCQELTKIFESHGAMQLKPPLLRPKVHLDNDREGMVELINERGIILLLPEDLTTNFARAIGRAGGLSVKRYDIDKTYHKSRVGGHPRESLEASFDIILEGANSKADVFEAEVIMVISRVLFKFFHYIPEASSGQPRMKVAPFWFLRLTNTRLSDAILDVCEVPQNESTRRACLQILTICSAPAPSQILSQDCDTLAKNKKNQENSANHLKLLEELLAKAMRNQGLSQAASNNLKVFLTCGCLPLPHDISKALQRLHDASMKLRSSNEKSKKNKRYFDIARGIRSLQNLVGTLGKFGIHPNLAEDHTTSTGFLPPSYISLDLGLRQQQRRYNGQLYFQALVLPDNCEDQATSFNRNDILLSSNPKLAVKVAEGGRYEDLVRKFRPPGNFASIQVDQYTSAPIPMCIGSRIFVRRLLERAYLEASCRAKLEASDCVSNVSTSENESMRRSLGHPDDVYSRVQCVIVSMNGFDSETLSQRATIASILWSEGISNEYVLQSGVMMGLLRQAPTEVLPTTCNWTIDEIESICNVLQIPFLVIVQDHLLRDKESVRLRWVGDSDHTEDFVQVKSLASEIRDGLKRRKDGGTGDKSSQITKQPTRQYSDADSSRNTTFDIELIYVDSDQFYIGRDSCSGRDQKSKSIKKMMKTCTQRVSAHLERLFSKTTNVEGCTTIAVDVPFMVLRDFNSSAMYSEGPTVVASVSDVLTKHTKYRKTLKTLATCIDHLLRQKQELFNTETNGKMKSSSVKAQSKSMSAIIYSWQDDKIDLLTISI